jgi:hypothetical protein
MGYGREMHFFSDTHRNAIFSGAHMGYAVRKMLVVLSYEHCFSILLNFYFFQGRLI